MFSSLNFRNSAVCQQSLNAIHPSCVKNVLLANYFNIFCRSQQKIYISNTYVLHYFTIQRLHKTFPLFLTTSIPFVGSRQLESCRDARIKTNRSSLTVTYASVVLQFLEGTGVPIDRSVKRVIHNETCKSGTGNRPNAMSPLHTRFLLAQAELGEVSCRRSPPPL